MTLPAYPTYRASGIEWFREIPEHWVALALKRRHRVVNGGTPASGESSFWQGDLTWITPEDLGRNEKKRIGGSRRTLSSEGLESCGAELVPANSVVLSTRAPIGHVAMTDGEACTNQGCRALVPLARSGVADLTYYSLVASRDVLRASGKGTTFKELAADALGLHPVPVPPSDEQLAIVDFLDRWTARVDTLVAKKLTLIERLKEKRTALISRVITGGLPPHAARAAGLDPHPKVRDSGVEWLGELPAHWDVVRLKHQASINDEVLPETTEPGLEISYVDISSVDATKGIVATRSVSFDRAPSRARRVVRDGDTIVSTVRTYLRAVAPVRNPRKNTIVSTGFAVVRPRGVTPAFLSWVLREAGFIDALVSRSVGVSYPAVSPFEIGRLAVPLPTKEEQQTIAEFLENETARIDSTVASVEAAIERLQEYRFALITAAVTGQIDVRGVWA